MMSNMMRMKAVLKLMGLVVASYIVTISIILNVPWGNSSKAVKHATEPFHTARVTKAATRKPPCAPDALGPTLGLHLVTSFRSLSKDVAVVDRDSYMLYLAMKTREIEILGTIKRNLRNPNITRIHLLHTQQSEKLLKTGLKGCKRSKLTLYLLTNKSSVTYGDIFRYLNDANLLRHLVMVANSDVYLGDGFELIQGDRLGYRKIVYALTRRETQTRRCLVKDLCGEFSQYTGSHAAFLFNLTTKTPKEVLEEMDFTPESLYADNALLWIVKMKLKRTVRNPCKEIHVHEVDCGERIQARVRYKGHGLAPFTGL